MKHAKTFVKVPSSASLSSPSRSSSTASAAQPLSQGLPSAAMTRVEFPVAAASGETAAPGITAADDDKDVDGIFQAMGCSVRRRVLGAVCDAGRAHVTMLCQLTRLSRTVVGHHLKDLRLRGLLLARQEGRHVWYQCNTAVVRRHHQGDRSFLTISSPSGFGVIVFSPAKGVVKDGSVEEPPAPALPISSNQAA
jgi:DNA-binding transcriptional ArsR family regulator